MSQGNPSKEQQSNEQQAHHAARQEWEKRTALWSSMASTDSMELPKDFDINDPKWKDQVKVEIGPPMSAEQFQKWQAARRQMMKK